MSEPQRLRVNEIFHSLQGEGTRAGARCVFIRLTGCNLRCAYCDTPYAFDEGDWMTLDQIIERVHAFECPMVEVTGGEPLLQPNVYPLMDRLVDQFETVLLETSGTVSIARVDQRVVRIVDFKCPSSGAVERNDWTNVDLLTERDEVKFVIGDRADVIEMGPAMGGGVISSQGYGQGPVGRPVHDIMPVGFLRADPRTIDEIEGVLPAELPGGLHHRGWQGTGRDHDEGGPQ